MQKLEIGLTAERAGWRSKNDWAIDAEGVGIDFRGGQIGHSIANGSHLINVFS